MKILLALCFTALCLPAPGQTTRSLFTKDVWRDYMAINKKMARLEAQVKSISLDTLEKKGLVRLQSQARKLSSAEAMQAERAADKALASKSEPLQKEIARLRLQQQALEMRYAMPAALPFQPEPAKQPKP